MQEISCTEFANRLSVTRQTPVTPKEEVEMAHHLAGCKLCREQFGQTLALLEQLFGDD